jgi:hypothetical protein
LVFLSVERWVEHSVATKAVQKAVHSVVRLDYNSAAQ